jgi:hypothetical protein
MNDQIRVALEQGPLGKAAIAEALGYRTISASH